MSDAIDWSKAPEGYPIWIQGKDSYYASGWHRELSDRYQCPSGVYYMKRDSAVFTVHTCPQQTQWSGEGLPPVGVVCEFKSPSSGGWLKARIIFVSAWTVVLYVFFEHDEHCYSVSAFEKGNLQFRPIRTPEQIAADERELFARTLTFEMGKDPIDAPNAMNQARKMYDLGYRKQ